jgi:hypothetical protein
MATLRESKLDEADFLEISQLRISRSRLALALVETS